jgi:hypothetical protein
VTEDDDAFEVFVNGVTRGIVDTFSRTNKVVFVSHWASG